MARETAPTTVTVETAEILSHFVPVVVFAAFLRILQHLVRLVDAFEACLGLTSLLVRCTLLLVRVAGTGEDAKLLLNLVRVTVASEAKLFVVVRTVRSLGSG